MNAFLLFFLLSQSGLVPDSFGHSPLADVDHKHEWTAIGSNDENRIWIDQAYKGSVQVGGKTFPTVLIRSIYGDLEKTPIRLDGEHAINCAYPSHAMTRISNSQDEKAVRDVHDIGFSDLLERHDLRERKMLEIGCQDFSTKGLTVEKP